MEKIIHLYCWEELEASGRVSMSIHLIVEGLSDFKALQWAHWQVVAFRLPLAQYEALGWKDVPPRFSGLCPTDLMSHTEASGPKDFWAMRQ